MDTSGDSTPFKELDSLGTIDLLEKARVLTRTRDHDDDERWAAINALRGRSERGVFDQAVAWCGSAEPTERSLGADILAQLGAPDFPFAAASAPTLAALLHDGDEDVVVDALYGLGHLRVGTAAELTPFARHPSDRVRRAAVHAFGWRDEPEIVDALVMLTADQNAEVRDWATFGLGTLGERDSTQIREALAARLTDQDANVRCEAMVGLARRQDPRAIDAIAAALGGVDVPALAIEAAELMPSALFVDLLRDIVRSSPSADALRALERCEAADSASN